MDSTVRNKPSKPADSPVPVITLLDIVAVVAKKASSSSQIASTVMDLVSSRRLKLIGNFRTRDIRALH